MKVYYIHTMATADKPEETRGYLLREYKEVLESLKEAGRPHKTWIETVQGGLE